MVRSKSEAHIAWALYNHHIPYRYECDLQTEATTYYPDFTIRHPKTGELYIWEHFGMMDNPTYYQTAFGKMETYNKLGYVLSVNFIATFETSSHPLDFELVEAIIQHYFS